MRDYVCLGYVYRSWNCTPNVSMFAATARTVAVRKMELSWLRHNNIIVGTLPIVGNQLFGNIIVCNQIFGYTK